MQKQPPIYTIAEASIRKIRAFGSRSVLWRHYTSLTPIKKDHLWTKRLCIDLKDIYDDVLIYKRLRMFCAPIVPASTIKDWFITKIIPPDYGTFATIEVIITVGLAKASIVEYYEEPMCAVGLKHMLSDEPSYTLRYIEDPSSVHDESLTSEYSCVKNFQIVDE